MWSRVAWAAICFPAIAASTCCTYANRSAAVTVMLGAFGIGGHAEGDSNTGFETL